MNNLTDIIDNNRVLSVKLAGLNVSTITNTWLNDAESVIFGDKSLDYLIYRNGAHIHDEHRNKTCITFNSNNNKFANGNLIFYIDSFFCITTSEIIANTNDTEFYAVIMNNKLWEFNVVGIDRTLGILIGKLDISGSATRFYNGNESKVTEGVSVNETYNMNPSVISPFDDPKKFSISETVYIINNSIYNSHILNVGILIDNDYKADNFNKTTIESILVSYRLNNKTENGITFYDGGSFVITNKGKILGLLTQQLSANSSSDKNISIAVSSNLVSAVILKYLKRDANGITFDQNIPILNNFLGISYYPLTPASKAIDSIDLNSFFKSFGKLGGIVVNGFAHSYNGTNFTEINYTNILGSNIKLDSPLLGTNIYSKFMSANKPIITSISFFNTTKNQVIPLKLGSYLNQNSLSKFIYEYGVDAYGMYGDIDIEYYYLSGSDYVLAFETIYSMKTIYQSNTINNGISIVIPNINLVNNRFNINNLNFSTYSTKLVANAEWPTSGNQSINTSVLSGIDKAIIFIYSDYPGTLIVNNTHHSYNDVKIYKEYRITIPTSGSFNLLYKNGDIDQTKFRMEVFFVSDYNVKIQQNTQLPIVLAGKENIGQYRYEKSSGVNYINSSNYSV